MWTMIWLSLNLASADNCEDRCPGKTVCLSAICVEPDLPRADVCFIRPPRVYASAVLIAIHEDFPGVRPQWNFRKGDRYDSRVKGSRALAHDTLVHLQNKRAACFTTIAGDHSYIGKPKNKRGVELIQPTVELLANPDALTERIDVHLEANSTTWITTKLVSAKTQGGRPILELMTESEYASVAHKLRSSRENHVAPWLDQVPPPESL